MSASDHVPRVTLAALEQEVALRIEAIAAAEGCSGKEAAERLLARWRRERDRAAADELTRHMEATEGYT